MIILSHFKVEFYQYDNGDDPKSTNAIIFFLLQENDIEWDVQK